ncbi:unnamed protein product [Amoebophrya sp. A25]|nr:unnamed protein product [Amoebophrya sp. A25]|eukprot:GSA25T00011627001.1
MFVFPCLGCVTTVAGVYTLRQRKAREAGGGKSREGSLGNDDAGVSGSGEDKQKKPVDEMDSTKMAYFSKERKDWMFSLQAEAPRPKMVYNNRDFCDYMAMLLLSLASCLAVYGREHLFSRVAVGSTIFLALVFMARHGVLRGGGGLTLSLPAVLQPHLVLAWVRYKIANMRPAYYGQVALFAAEISLLQFLNNSSVAQGAHAFFGASGTAALQNIFWFATLGMFYVNFGFVSVFRVVSYLDHVRQHDHVFEFLKGTGWKKTLQFSPDVVAQSSKFLDHITGLTHALVTGVWTQVVTIIPWFWMLATTHNACCDPGADNLETSTTNSAETNASTIDTMKMNSIIGNDHLTTNLLSNVFEFQSSTRLNPCLILVAFGSWALRFFVFEQRLLQDFERNDLNDWYIRDHWLGHFSKIGFSYLHGPHHDALPVGFIAVADNGPLEGLLRHFFGHFDSFACPPYAFFRWTKTIVRDIVGHQYVPGVLPWSMSVVDYGVHHVEHHFLSMYPLGNGIQGDPDPRNNCEVETWLSNGSYRADNKVWTWFVSETKRLELGQTDAGSSTRGKAPLAVIGDNQAPAGGGNATGKTQKDK